MTYEIQRQWLDWKPIAVEYSLRAAKSHLSRVHRFAKTVGGTTKYRIVRVTYEVL